MDLLDIKDSLSYKDFQEVSRMLFAEWMDANKIKPEDVTEEVAKNGLETSLDMIYKVRASKRRFSPEINRVIVVWSKGEVSWEELNFPEEFQKAASG